MPTTRLLPLSFLTLAACAPPPIVIEGVSLQMNPNESAPLAAVLDYTSDRPVRPLVTLRHEAEDALLIQDMPFAASGPTPVLGLRSSRVYAVTVTFESEDGLTSEYEDLFRLTTPPLPDDFPSIEITTLRPQRMDPGYHFIPVMRWAERGPDREFGLVLALDGAGEIVWYYRTNKSVNDIKRLDNGDLIYLAGRDGWMIQINKLGEVVHHWHATGIPKGDVPEGSIPVDCDSFHHDFMVMESGHFFALSTEVRQYEEYATSERNPDAIRAPATVIGDVIVEFNRAGEVLRRWKLFDILDPYRVSHGSLGIGFWKEPYKDILDEPGKDWGHANSIVYDASDDSVIVSLNHQSAIVKMRLEDSSIAWILGDHNGWREPWSEHLLDPSGEVLWTGHQHAAELTPTGTVLVFDNGGHRGPPFSREVPDEKRYSRVVEFKVDEEHGTVEEVWSYGSIDTDHFFSSFLCDVDLQATTGNVIVTDGARVSGPNVKAASGRAPGHHWGHIFELDRDSNRKVFEMTIEGEDGWAVYRSERFPTLY